MDAGSGATSRTGRLFWAVLGVAILVHLPVAWQYPADPFSATLISDALSYDEWAQQIASHGLAQEPVFHQAPLFPVLLSWIYLVAAPAVRWNAAIAAGIVCTSLAVALLVLVGKLYFRSAAAGAVGAVLVLLHGPFVLHSFKLLPLPLAIATQAAALVALGIARERATLVWASVAGATLGIAALARSEVLLFFPFAFACVWLSAARDRGRRARLVAGFLVGLALGVAPATLHNLRQGDVVLIASSGGENLYIGNKRGAKGDYTALHPKAGDLFSERILAREVAEKETGRPLRPSQVSAYWRHAALAEIAADPIGWARIEARKLARVLHPGDPTDIYSFPLERDLYLSSLRALMLPAWILLGSGIAGAVFALTRLRERAWPLVGFALVQLGVLLVFFVSTRLRLPLLFSMAPFGGLALVAGWRAWRERRGRALVGAAGALLAVAGIAGALLARPQPRDLVRLASVLSMQGKLDEGLRVLEPALSLSPPYAMALDHAGWLLQKKGEFAAARDRYREALAADPAGARAVQTRTRLAMVLERLGDFAGARAEHDDAAADSNANAGTYYERGLFRLRRGERDAALLDLREAVRLDPAWEAPRAAIAAAQRDP